MGGDKMSMKKLPVQDTNGSRCEINTSQTSSLYDVRFQIVILRTQFAQPGHFRIFLNDKILSIDEEQSTKAWDVVEANKQLILLPTSYNPAEEGKKRSSDTPIFEETATKKACIQKSIGSPPQQQPRILTASTNIVDISSVSSDELLALPLGFDLANANGSVDRPSVDRAIPGGSKDLSEETTRYVTPTLESYEPPVFDLQALKNDPLHIKIDQAHERSIHLLKKVKEIINNPSIRLFCPSSQRDEWTKEINELAKEPKPEITIGVLGCTGSGKTSLLKALIHEDKILPTSSSRGCTAAAIELKFNRAFFQTEAEIVVYQGKIDFISLTEWKEELDLLIDDCCDDETGIVSQSRREESEDIAASWSKIDAVYGSGTMISYDGKSKKDFFGALSTDDRVVKLLTCTTSEQKHNVLDVSEGQINPSKADAFLRILVRPGDSHEKVLVRKQRRWAESFRKKINSFVYRKGNGKEPQTWPLIRKVVLLGPWKCLSTGACLVDLPGVRDDNAARAKVAERYLQNCTKIWIVSPIKRAVDDKTAKDLLGDEFKRRLLMDGNYGNVSFVCTHSDYCEISEIMQDHEGVAKAKEGRWERMLSLREAISARAKCDEELEDEIDVIKDQLADIESREPSSMKRKKLETSLELLRACLEESTHQRSLKRRNAHQQLKGLASEVRNEFSKISLQIDFKNGIEELLKQPSKSSQGSRGCDEGYQNANLLPTDFALEVFCTASNEYLKLCGVKVGSDGDATCFSSVGETGIPEVFHSVLDATEKFRIDHARTYLQKAGNVLGRVYLYASECKVDAGSANLLSKAFRSEMEALVPAMKQIALSFGQTMEENIRNGLEPDLRLAATKGDTDGFSVVNAWFESRPRNRQEPKNKGLHWATFGAAARRGGVYKSSSVGPISLNQELYNPLEKEYFASWRQVMVAELNRHLSSARVEMLAHCEKRLESIGILFKQIGLDSLTIQWMQAAGKNGYESIVDGAFRKLRHSAMKKSRRLNRSNTPKLRQKLRPTYSAVSSVARGCGVSSRQMTTMKAGAKKTLTLKEFDPMMTELNKEVIEMTKALTQSMLDETNTDITKCLEQVFCLSWNDEGYMTAMEDPKVFVGVFDARNALLPNLVRLCASHDNILDHLGIAREYVHRVERNNPDGYEQARCKLISGG